MITLSRISGWNQQNFFFFLSSILFCLRKQKIQNCTQEKRSAVPLHINVFRLFFSENCRDLVFSTTRLFDGKRLINYVISAAEVKDKQFCAALCFMENNCFSYNTKTRVINGKLKCELNNATHEGHENDLLDDPDYFYCAAEV